ncbi:Na/Pi cotransporter family protein [Marinicrinis lubricantis]|uniref:Na/Pi cotransporter family protein n=1 Tax=Marinicrinis lubricantis TaxID=2086470 RepID=A0ABW1IUX3_9BACL
MFHSIMIPLLAGLAVFLFGMKVMEIAMQRWAGPYLKGILEKFTETPLRGMVTGTVMTALLQSSSALTALTISLVNARLLTFPRTLGIILGTNIGSCLTTELISLHISDAAIPILLTSIGICGVAWLIPDGIVQSRSSAAGSLHAIRYLTMAAAGFAAVLMGMEIMSSIVPTLQTTGFYSWFLENASRSLIWGVVAGACLTAIIQSSAASIAIAMGLASAHAISVELGIAIILGANIGTCLTAFIASIGGSRSGRFVAWSHFLLNAFGALLFFPLIWMMKDMALLLSDIPSVQLAHVQTFYNVACSLLALPFCYLPVWKRWET